MARKDNSGYIAPDNKPKTKEEQRDHKGSCSIDGVEYWISGWNNEGESGPYVNLKFNRKESSKNEHSESKANAYQPKQPAYVKQEDVKTSTEDSDSIPF